MGGVRNLQVVEPTFNSLKVRWDPAVGNVRSYKVSYTADPGGETQVVGSVPLLLSFYCSLKGQNHAHVLLNRRRCREAPPAPP